MLKERQTTNLRTVDFINHFLSEQQAPLLIAGGGIVNSLDSETNAFNRARFIEVSWKILSNLADDKWSQIQREAALIALAHLPTKNFQYSLPEITVHFLEVLGQQNKEHHPYAAAENLFDAGVILFADMPLAEESRQSIIAEMERIAGYFSSDIPTHDGLRETIGKFSKRKESDNAIPARTSPKRVAPPQYALRPESQVRAIKPFSRRRTKLREEAA